MILLGGMMSRFGRFWLVAAALLVATGAVSAQDRIARQINLLRTSSDFRVRTQAALALGSSKNKRAVEALCRALDDGNTTVRIASAAGLGRLQLGGVECLRERLEREQSGNVKGSIQRALAKLGGAAPTINDGTRFYVAIGTIKHDTKRSDVDSVVRSGMSKAASAAGQFAIAPSGETSAQAQAVLDKHGQLKAFYLAPKLTLSYSGGRLNIKLSVAMLSYPEKNMIGQFTKTVASPTSEPDASLEAELISYAAEGAMKQFAQVAPRL
jgi:hypothetical protein